MTPALKILDTCNFNATCGCLTKDAVSQRLVRRESEVPLGVVGGQSVNSQVWGWAVSLRIDTFLCGGSIIGASWILTAAHCVDGFQANQITIYAGSIERHEGSQILYVSKIIMHSGYNYLTKVNDIALLYLSTPLNLTDPNINVICLPSSSSTPVSISASPPIGTKASLNHPLDLLRYANSSRLWL